MTKYRQFNGGSTWFISSAQPLVAMDEKEKLYIDQKLKHNIEILKILSITILATMTGVLSLIAQGRPGMLTGKMTILIFFGLVIITILTILVIFVYRDSLKLLKRLENGI